MWSGRVLAVSGAFPEYCREMQQIQRHLVQKSLIWGGGCSEEANKVKASQAPKAADLPLGGAQVSVPFESGLSPPERRKSMLA